MFENQGGNKRQQSEFNSAVSYLNRINILFSNADESAINLNAFTWFHTLLALFRELSTEMTKDEIMKMGDTTEDLNNGLNKFLKQSKRTGDTSVPPELYKGLHDFEMSLRKVMKESGLQQKTMDEAEKALR